ncbi:hypothetical protein OG21DRAFT_557995 [Imleria badia]|nr:hypothetical protein OG21DRAFT_557995 [Imleria badia]
MKFLPCLHRESTAEDMASAICRPPLVRHRAFLVHMQPPNRNLQRWTWNLMSRLLSLMVRRSIANEISLNDKNQRGSNGVTDTFASGRTLAARPHAILRTQPAPDSSPGFSYYHENHETDLYRLLSSTSSGSIEAVTNFVSNETQSAVETYQPEYPEKMGSSHRSSQPACAINFEGLWIDKDDLDSAAGRGDSMISVHECQWDMTSNPCGMWIVCDRSRVGAHIRKWHTGEWNASRKIAKCLWGGCTATMHTDSINRHVLSVHLGEAFHCQGCDKEFARKDTYIQHVKRDDVCRHTGPVKVYGTKRRVIDTRNAVRQGVAIRYAGQ